MYHLVKFKFPCAERNLFGATFVFCGLTDGAVDIFDNSCWNSNNEKIYYNFYGVV